MYTLQFFFIFVFIAQPFERLTMSISGDIKNISVLSFGIQIIYYLTELVNLVSLLGLRYVSVSLPR